jgi:membrane protease YdiL (CAAX protease family)
MTAKQFFDRAGKKAVGAYLAVWAVSTAYIAVSGGDWTFPIISLLLFGCAISALIWFLTRKMDAPEVPVANAARESIAFLGYILLYAVLLIAIGLGAVKTAIPPGQTQDVAVVAYKLLIHVAVPAALVLLLGSSLRPLLDSGTGRRGFWTTLIVLCALAFGLLSLVSPSLKNIAATGVTGAAAILWVLGSWAWTSVEAGFCEEFLFRACLQSRLIAWFRSPAAGIALTSVLFALSHWPGLYLRGGPGVDGWSTDPVQVAAFTIATLSPLAVAMGLLWSRSRSLLLVVLFHGAIDALPNTADFIHVWG